ncbi:hypothetical protein ACIQK6_32380 [Streptomyces sp. NPDC091682]|uniref:hypothetical protein n=1 Tax=Streptomyces sp. NPDC091682 TaxID=3366005 RepID=UPI0038254BA5
MSGPDIVIDRLSATLRHPAEEAPAIEDRLRGPLRHVVGGRLEAALRGLRLPPGRWCLSRLDLTLPLDLTRPDPALAQDWSLAVVATIERTVREGAGAVVHYRHDVELLADVVTGLANGRTERLWAWRQTGILRPGDPSPDASPGAAILTALDRHPEQAAAALLRAADACGLAPLDRALGRAGWQRLAAALAVPEWSEPRPGPDPDPAVHQSTRTLAAALPAGSRLASLVRETGLRPTEDTLTAWAVLLVAETDPAALHRPPRAGLPLLLAGALRALTGAPERQDATPRPIPRQLPPPVPAEGDARARKRDRARLPAPSAGADSDPTDRPAPPLPPPATRDGALAPPSRPGPAEGPRRGHPVRATDDSGARPTVRAVAGGLPPEQAPGGPDPLGGIATGWAGLLFLIATAAEAGLPERALDEPGLAARPLPWVLHTAGRALVPGIVAEDAALLALAGLGPARAALVLGTQEPTPEELACVHALAADWARATAVRLHGGGPDDPDGVVAAVARRPGRITAEPGWIEAHLAVADTDLAVRRAGLDLDPGWVPWLGSVVRYVYA